MFKGQSAYTNNSFIKNKQNLLTLKTQTIKMHTSTQTLLNRGELKWLNKNGLQL